MNMIFPSSSADSDNENFVTARLSSSIAIQPTLDVLQQFQDSMSVQIPAASQQRLFVPAIAVQGNDLPKEEIQLQSNPLQSKVIFQDDGRHPPRNDVQFRAVPPLGQQHQKNRNDTKSSTAATITARDFLGNIRRTFEK